MLDGAERVVNGWFRRHPGAHDQQDAIDQRLRILIDSYAELQGPVVLLPQRTEVFWQRRR